MDRVEEVRAQLTARLHDRIGSADDAEMVSAALRQVVREDAESLQPLSLTEIRSLSSDLGWNLRRFRTPFRWETLIDVDDISGSMADMLLVVLAGQLLRYDFRFSSLAALTDAVASRFPHDDAMLRSLAALAAAGLQMPDVGGQLRSAAELVDADWRSLHVCLHGWWLTLHCDGHPKALLELADRLTGLERGGANVEFRRAAALRHLALVEHDLGHLDEALAAMTSAFDNAPLDPEVNQDYVRERELIALTYTLMRTQAT